MNNWKILLPIETTSRELFYKLYLCNCLIRLGFECYIGKKNQIYNLFSRLGPFIFIDKGFHLGISEKIYDEIRKNNGILVSLDEEGGVDYADLRTVATRYPKLLFDCAEKVFVWGSKQKQFLEKKGFTNFKIIISGHPRFQLLKPKYINHYKDEIKIIKDKEKDFILILNNCSIGNNIKGDKFVIKNYKNRINNIEDIIEFDKLKIKQILRLCQLIVENTNEKVVVRPHPEENHEIYKNYFSSNSRVIINTEMSVIPWIINSKFVIHPDCTTAIEAAFLGKTVYSILPYFDENLVAYSPYKVSKVFFNEDDLVNYIENTELKPPANVMPILNDYFSYDKNSSEIVIKELENIRKNNLNVSRKDLKIRYKIYSKLLLSFKKVINTFKVSKKENIFIKQKRGNFNLKTIKKITNQINSHDNHSDNLNIEEINKDLFCLKQINE